VNQFRYQMDRQAERSGKELRVGEYFFQLEK
jgi:hypothetical protein